MKICNIIKYGIFTLVGAVLGAIWMASLEEDTDSSFDSSQFKEGSGSINNMFGNGLYHKFSNIKKGLNFKSR